MQMMKLSNHYLQANLMIACMQQQQRQKLIQDLLMLKKIWKENFYIDDDDAK